MKRHLTSFLLITGLILTFTAAKKPETEIHLVTPGKGFDKVKVNETTLEDLQKMYGKKYKTDSFYTTSNEEGKTPAKKLYSYRIAYNGTGMSFYFYPGQAALFSIHLQKPFACKTPEGIELGVSTFNDVVKIYGEAEWEFSSGTVQKEYPGVRFGQKFKGKLPATDKKLETYIKRKVTEINIMQQ